MYLSYTFRVCYEIYSGFTAAKVQLFCDICKRKGHFLSKKGKKTPKNDDNPEGVAKKIKKSAFFCMTVWRVFTQFLLFGK